MQFPITIGLRRSRFLDTFLLLAAFLASAVVLAFPQSISVRVALLVVIWLIAYRARQRMLPKVATVRLEENGRISLIDESEQAPLAADLLPGAIAHPWLTALRLKKEDGRTCALIVAVDSLNAEDFRRLRIFLRWRAEFSARSDGA